MGRRKKIETIEIENILETNEIIRDNNIVEVEENKENKAKNKEKSYKIIDCMALRIRKEANLESEVLGTVGHDEIVVGLDEDEEWVRVENGYMMKKYLEEVK